MGTEPPETITVNEGAVACDGGGGPLGHPRVYLTLGTNGWVECPYCDRRFLRAKDPQGDAITVP